MPTVRTRTVKPSGGDYTSLVNWESGEQADLPTLDEVRQAECYAMNDVPASTFTITGWTTDATRYIRIYAEPAAYAKLPPNFTTTYRCDGSSPSNFWAISEDHVRVEGITFRRTQTAGGRAIGITNVGSSLDIRIERCVFVGSGDTTHTNDVRAIAVVTAGTSGIKVVNCAAIDWTSNSTGQDFGGAFVQGGVTSALMYNCTVFNSRRVICATGLGNWTLKNVGYDGNGTAQQAFYSSSDSSTPSGTNNASNLADAPGSNPRNSVNPAFVAEGSDNLHLAFTDTAWLDQGTDLSADATYPVTLDFDGRTRSGTWEIGADEPVVLPLEVASYSFSPQAIGLLAQRLLVLGTASYTFSPQDTTTTITGGPAPVVEIAGGGLGSRPRRRRPVSPGLPPPSPHRLVQDLFDFGPPEPPTVTEEPPPPSPHEPAAPPAPEPSVPVLPGPPVRGLGISAPLPPSVSDAEAVEQLLAELPARRPAVIRGYGQMQSAPAVCYGIGRVLQGDAQVIELYHQWLAASSPALDTTPKGP